jgi:hypothetical protein
MRARLPTLIFAAGLLVWIVNAAIMWIAGSPLGHDESQYVLAATDLLAGDAPRWFYASSGMSLVAVPGAMLGGEIAARFPTFVLGIAFVLAAAGLAWRTYGAMTAAWVVAVLAGLRSVMGMSADLLSDLPATAFLLGGTLVMLTEVIQRTEPLRWRVVIAAPVLACALYLRYASCIPIAILGVATLVLGWRAIARRPLPIVATAAVFLALLVPHLYTAYAETGSPLGILLASKDVPGKTWFAQGLATYVTSNPIHYYGLLAAPVFLAGLAAIIRFKDRATLLLWIVAVADIAVLGVVSHAQVRYIFFGVALLVILGVETIRIFVGERRILGIACAVAVVAAWVLVASSQVYRSAHRWETTAATRAAAAAIAADAAGAPCHVVGDAFAQLELYSGCRSSSWPWDTHQAIYVVRTPKTAPVETRGTPRTLLERPDVSVTRYDR